MFEMIGAVRGVAIQPADVEARPSISRPIQHRRRAGVPAVAARLSHGGRGAGREPADCCMVASHVWDAIGAQSVGFSAALITRPGNAPLPAPGLPQPNIVAPTCRRLRPV